MAFLETIIEPFQKIANTFLDIGLDILAAIILLIIGYFIALLCGFIVRNLLEKLGLDKKMEEAKLTDAIGKIDLSHLIGSLIKWYVFIAFIGEAAKQSHLYEFSELIGTFINWLPNLLVGVAILLAGLIFADFLAKKLADSKIKSVRLVSLIAKVLILFFVFIIALSQIGLNVGIASNSFLIILGSVGLGFAIAMGIGFGMAFKDEAKGLINKVRTSKP